MQNAAVRPIRISKISSVQGLCDCTMCSSGPQQRSLPAGLGVSTVRMVRSHAMCTSSLPPPGLRPHELSARKNRHVVQWPWSQVPWRRASCRSRQLHVNRISFERGWPGALHFEFGACPSKCVARTSPSVLICPSHLSISRSTLGRLCVRTWVDAELGLSVAT